MRTLVRVVLDFLSLRPAVRATVGFAVLASTLAAPVPARADEKATLENALLVEQLVDVATTQQLLHTSTCAPARIAINRGHVLVSAAHYCVSGVESDPLARPFVASAGLNVGAALAVNGLVRLASRQLTPGTTRLLRLAVAVYPSVIVGTVAATIGARRFTPTISFSFTHHP